MNKNIGRIVATVAGVLLLAYLLITSFPPVTERLAEVAARGFVSYCGKMDDRIKCYEENVPKLLHAVPLNTTFSVVRQILRQDPSYRFCHVLGHELGVFEVNRNPDAWVDLMHRNPPDSLCSNGYIHGVIVGKFHANELPKEKIDELVPDLSRACEGAPGWTPSYLDKAMCYHGMGHVLTFITGANLDLAVSYCGLIARKGREDNTEVCTSGVFMQIFQPLEPEDYALIARLPVKPTKETLPAFCNAFDTEAKRRNCYAEGWPLFREELQSAKGMQQFCESSKEGSVVETCYRAVFAIGARGSIGNPGKELSTCMELPAKRAQQCINALANAFVEEDRTKSGDAVAVCTSAPTQYLEGCLNNLMFLKHFNFIEGSKEAKNLCESMPEPFRQKCHANR